MTSIRHRSIVANEIKDPQYSPSSLIVSYDIFIGVRNAQNYLVLRFLLAIDFDALLSLEKDGIDVSFLKNKGNQDFRFCFRSIFVLML